MNVLLTSAGRRGYLVQYFKEALNGKGKVFVTNSTQWCTSFQYADESAVSPLIYDDEYIPFLLSYCQEHEIDILIPLFDIDLPVLAKNKQKFETIGTRIIVSEPSVIDVCNDKWKTYQFLKESGFHVPETYIGLQEVMQALRKGDLQYPIIVKPRFGCGSLAMSVAEDEAALLFHYRRNARTISHTYLKYESDSVEDKILFQEMLKGQEYGVDVIHDLKGNFQTAVIKEKFAMRAGETDIARLVENEIIFNETKRLGEVLGHIGNLDCDTFLVDGTPYILEMNARFGGGYPFSHLGGCNLPKAIVAWAEGCEPDTDCFTVKPGKMIFKDLVLIEADNL